MADEVNTYLSDEGKRIEFLKGFFESNGSGDAIEDNMIAAVFSEITDALGLETISPEEVNQYVKDSAGKKADTLNFNEFYGKGTDLLKALKARGKF